MRKISAMKVWILHLYLVCVLCQSALIKSNCYFLIYSSLTKLNMEASDWLYQTKMHISLIAYEDNYQSIPPYGLANPNLECLGLEEIIRRMHELSSAVHNSRESVLPMGFNEKSQLDFENFYFIHCFILIRL